MMMAEMNLYGLALHACIEGDNCICISRHQSTLPCGPPPYLVYLSYLSYLSYFFYLLYLLFTFSFSLSFPLLSFSFAYLPPSAPSVVCTFAMSFLSISF